jgi:hypothetical protein
MTETLKEWPLIFFPEAVLVVLITGALVLTAIGAIALVWMLVRDRRRRQIW